MENSENKKQEKYFDFFGKELNVGDKVVYSNSAKDNSLRIGTIFENDNFLIGYDWNSRPRKEIYGKCICIKGETGHIFNLDKFFKNTNSDENLRFYHLIKI